MAGVKGRSGGARPGAGRPPKLAAAVVATPDPETAVFDDPLEFLKAAMAGRIIPTLVQLDAAKAAIRYTHAAPAAGGKKEQAAARAKTAAAAGKFANRRPPALKVVGA